jgi:hypothetical protein
MAPVSVALREPDGFSANVVQIFSPAFGMPPVSGEILGRQGRLIFQPWSALPDNMGSKVPAGMIFLWDTALQQGFVLSEDLQAYAPISPPALITNVVPCVQNPPSRNVNGHPCRQVAELVVMDDGSISTVTEWRAQDLAGFPVRLSAIIRGRQLTVDFSDIRLDSAPQDLFATPAGFTEYATAGAMMDELIHRELNLNAQKAPMIIVESDLSSDNFLDRGRRANDRTRDDQRDHDGGRTRGSR